MNRIDLTRWLIGHTRRLLAPLAASVAARIANQLLGVALLALAATAVVLWRGTDAVSGSRIEPRNPTHLRSAIAFGGLYAGILLAVAAAEATLGSRGLYATAVLSGLTDIDAITLSTSRLVSEGRVAESVGWRLIVVASLSNLAFKLGMAWVLGGRRLAGRLGGVAGIVALAGITLIMFWR